MLNFMAYTSNFTSLYHIFDDVEVFSNAYDIGNKLNWVITREIYFIH